MKKLLGIVFFIALSSCFVSCEDDFVIGETTEYNISISATGGGNASFDGFTGSSITVENNMQVTIVAVPAAGTSFIGWYIGEIPVSNDLRYTFIVENSLSLIARFKEVEDRTNVTPEIYERDLSEEDVENAIDALKKNGYLGQSLTGQYNMRGGKENGMPSGHAYQRQYSLGPDLYAQYFTVPHKDFMWGSHTSTYDLSAEFNSGPLGAYTQAKNAFMPVLHHSEIDNIPEIKAIVLLYYCLIAQEHADLSGPFTYFEDRLNVDNPTQYNDLETIYHDIVKSLDNIVACLKYYEENRPDWYKKNIVGILDAYHQTSRSLLNGDKTMNSYIKLANSLKLRMAMHIVKVQPETAKKWAEEAVASGVIESTEEQQGLYPMVSGFAHPLMDIQNWGDLCFSASFIGLLKSLDHPYLKYFVLRNSYEIDDRRTGEKTPANDDFYGIREGVLVPNGQIYSMNQYQAYSKFDSNILGRTFAPLYFVKFAEVDFLRAEGVLRGWNMGGTAEFFYNRGIENAYFEDPLIGPQYSAYVKDYMALESPINHTVKDPIGDGTWESFTKIGVKWNEGDDNETKLEKIITQKYLALFPLSTEAWTELRRTGYPTLFPVLNTDDGDGSIMQGDMIRRIPWVPTDSETKEIVNKSGIPALGGPDLQATRLWWDIDVPNF